jgi:hypothetical protein
MLQGKTIGYPSQFVNGLKSNPTLGVILFLKEQEKWWEQKKEQEQIKSTS